MFLENAFESKAITIQEWLVVKCNLMKGISYRSYSKRRNSRMLEVYFQFKGGCTKIRSVLPTFERGLKCI